MKRYGNLWPELISFPNLLQAAFKARRGKRRFPNVAAFEFHLENELCRLQEELRTHRYQPGPYHTFTIEKPKPRLISAAPFRDRVVHHALCRVLEPIFERSFIADSYACRKGKGTHGAVKRLSAFLPRYRFVLKCDVRKYFPSMDHDLLKELLARKIKDRDVLWLAGLIIDHSNPQEPVQHWYPGDDLFTLMERRRGMPIGNQTSQFFANVYLNPLDHFVKERLGADAYVRYMDDFLLLGDDKGWLLDARERCRECLAALRLRLHPNKAVISRAADGVRFLGYRVFPGCRLLPRENVARMRRRMQGLQKGYARGALDWPDIQRSVAGWYGHALQADTSRLREAMFRRFSFRRSADNQVC